MIIDKGAPGPLGFSEHVIRKISEHKNEPAWMLELRLKAFNRFCQTKMPTFGPDLSGLRLDEICPFVGSGTETATTWEDVPQEIRKGFIKLGIPEAERKHLAGVGAQHESEMVYHKLKEEWTRQGVVFVSLEEGLKKFENLFHEYFGTIIPFDDNPFAMLNTAAWSGGSFVYVPKGVKIDLPLQTYFKIGSERLGQFERTLIIADEDSFVHYVEGCTAQTFASKSLHSGVVEIFAKKNSRVRYTTVQNWSKNIYNLVTKRAMANEGATIEWIDGNFGSLVTMKYPCVILKGNGARAEIISIASVCSKGQINDSGAKVIHLTPNTTSRVISKSICANGGQASYRGTIKIAEGASDCKSSVTCDSLMLDNLSKSNSYPKIDLNESAEVGHEAQISQIEETKLFFLGSRGIDNNEAQSMVINGFIEPFVKQLPMEFAIEMNQLLEKEIGIK